ncbi:MAG TPA: TIGR04255 family protein [Alphaproteobacteria bacterium]|nr:TIGR04255 family protein [Alphaproteobacteria bacterium]
MPPGNYKRPPIIEAVIAFGFAEPIETASFEKVRAKFAGEYTSVEPRLGLHVNIDAAVPMRPTSAQPRLDGYKLSTPDQTDIVLVDRQGFTTAKLAPYDGWPKFCAKAAANFDRYKAAVGRQQITRIATRYINRLDIPFSADGRVDPSNYMTVGPGLPSGLPTPGGYNVLVNFAWPEPRVRVNLITASVPPAIIGHGSFALDIDVYLDAGVPQKDADLWAYMDRLRDVKNAIFERCITDAARAIFDT